MTIAIPMFWVRYPVWQHTFVSPSAFSRRAVVSYWRKYVHEVLVNRLGGLSLPRKSVVRLTDRPDMTLDVYRGRKTTIHQYIIPMFPACIFRQHLKTNIQTSSSIKLSTGPTVLKFLLEHDLTPGSHNYKIGSG